MVLLPCLAVHAYCLRQRAWPWPFSRELFAREENQDLVGFAADLAATVAIRAAIGGVAPRTPHIS